MTIKEAEARTGLARANIRYYEDQGFFTTSRGENGYRNYSEENVDTLLKVKLLRQLGFSLDEIHALQKGEQSLTSALERREAGLERESRELSRAAQLCRDIREEETDFYTLDARRYLLLLSQPEEVLEKDKDPVRLFPWRRYFARALDLTICNSLLILALQLTARLNYVRLSDNIGSSLLLDLCGLLLMAGAETLMLHRWGTTPGKALLGLRIVREDGSNMSLEEAARRAGMAAAFYGATVLLADTKILLFSLPGLGMLIWACWQVYQNRSLPWEACNHIYLDGSTKVQAFWENGRNYFRIVGYLAIGAACAGLMVGGHFLAARPPHRGTNLTVEQFVDNYNQYMRFTYGAENLSRRLTPNGTFEEVPREDGGVVIHLTGNDHLPDPFFSFQQDGALKKVTLTWKYDSGVSLGENQSYMISVPYREIYVAMRSLLWGLIGEKEVDKVYNELVEGTGNYLGVLNGVQLYSEMRFSGFQHFSDETLLAQKGDMQSIFVEFTMELT